MLFLSINIIMFSSFDIMCSSLPYIPTHSIALLIIRNGISNSKYLAWDGAFLGLALPHKIETANACFIDGLGMHPLPNINTKYVYREHKKHLKWIIIMLFRQFQTDYFQTNNPPNERLKGVAVIPLRRVAELAAVCTLMCNIFDWFSSALSYFWVWTERLNGFVWKKSHGLPIEEFHQATVWACWSDGQR